MTEKPNSVCKHCDLPVIFEGNYWLEFEDGVVVYDLCEKNPNGRHEVEPVAEPAEPSASPRGITDTYAEGDENPNNIHFTYRSAPQPVAGEGPQISSGFDVTITFCSKDVRNLLTHPEFVRELIGDMLDKRGIEEEIDYTLEVKRAYR